MKTLKQLASLSLVCGLLLTTTACDREDQTTTIPVTGISISHTTASLAVGSTLQLSVTILPSDATNQNVTWTSGSPTVAMVSSTGLVTAVSVGSAVILVTTEDGNHSIVSQITVTDGPGETGPPGGGFDGRIVATVVNGSNYNALISSVGVFAEFETPAGWWDDEQIATGTWSNGGFTVTLPTTLQDRFLFNLDDILDLDNFTVSDRTARVSMLNGLWIDAFGSNGDIIGSFWNNRETENSWAAMFFMYADRNVTITGTDQGAMWRETTNLSLRRGWNRVFIEERDSMGWELSVVTTTPISGLRWYFNCWDCNGNQPPPNGGQRITINANVEGSNQLSFVSRVRATEGWDNTRETIAQGNFVSSGNTNFTLTLAQTPSWQNLWPVAWIEEYGFNVSNRDANISEGFSIRGYSSTSGAFSDTDLAGFFWEEFFESNATGGTSMWAFYIYADRNVEIFGEISGGWDGWTWLERMEISLRRGWNKVFEIGEWCEMMQTETFTQTTTPVSGLTWMFEPYWPSVASSNNFAGPARARVQAGEVGSNRPNAFVRFSQRAANSRPAEGVTTSTAPTRVDVQRTPQRNSMFFRSNR